MIKEAFVSFEVAKLLKEKGFHEPCIATYNSTTKKFHVEELYLDWSTQWESYISVPTHQMVMSWLRESHFLFIQITVDFSDTAYPMYDSTVINLATCDKIAITGYNRYNYKDAVEAALKYCLENLI